MGKLAARHPDLADTADVLQGTVLWAVVLNQIALEISKSNCRRDAGGSGHPPDL